jgi:hypothetical protein
MDSDPFDDLLGLEDKFYDEGFQLGSTDGAKAGRIEGRAFGLEKGFEKYIESGRLHGRSIVWAGRLAQSKSKASDRREDSVSQGRDQPTISALDGTIKFLSLPELPHNSRLEKHLKVLYALSEPISLSTENSEDAVSDFDDRQKRAIGKIKIIERLVGEEGSSSSYGSQQNSVGIADAGIEDVNVLRARH